MSCETISLRLKRVGPHATAVIEGLRLSVLLSDLTTARSATRRRLFAVRALRAAAWGSVLFWTILSLAYFIGFDQINYQAAAERLNAGHPLYLLGPGDRPVEINEPFWYSPLLYPPTIAVLWRPLAVVPLGSQIWWVIDALALLGTTLWVLRKSPLAVLIASIGVGINLASGNVAGLLAAGTVFVWANRHSPLIGALIALMVAIKLIPATLLAWLIATRRWRALAWAAAIGLALVVIDILGAGLDNVWGYLDVLRTPMVPVPLSVPGLTGIPTIVVIIVGLLLTLIARSDLRSFRIAVVTSVLGSPFVGFGSLVGLLPIGVEPLVRSLEKPAPPSEPKAEDRKTGPHSNPVALRAR